MKKLLFAFPVVILLAAGCNSSQQISNQTPAQTPVVQNTPAAPAPTPIPVATSTPTAPLTASNIIQGLTNTFTQQGYVIGTTNIEPAYELPNFWWLDSSGIAINLPETNTLSFNLKMPASKVYSAQDTISLPEADNTIQTTNSYLSSNGFNVQTTQSTGMPNTNTDYSYTRAYLNPQTSVRCRLFVYTTDDGGAPYPYTDSILCADGSDYAQAYSMQAPFLKGMTGGGSDSEGDLFVVELGTEQTCPGDPSLKLLTLDSANGSSSQVYAFKQVNGAWTEDNISDSQIDQLCK